MNRYFYIDAEGKQKGTFSPEELRGENLKRDSLVWTQGMGDWKRADEIEELRFLFADAFVQSAEPLTVSQQTTTYSDTPSYATANAATSMPKTWMVESILATILPFILCGSVLSLLGIIGIVHAAQVESAYNRGDYAAATEASRDAGKWTKIAFWIFICWLLLIVVGIILIIVLAGSLMNVGELFNA